MVNRFRIWNHKDVSWNAGNLCFNLLSVVWLSLINISCLKQIFVLLSIEYFFGLQNVKNKKGRKIKQREMGGKWFANWRRRLIKISSSWWVATKEFGECDSLFSHPLWLPCRSIERGLFRLGKKWKAVENSNSQRISLGYHYIIPPIIASPLF